MIIELVDKLIDRCIQLIKYNQEIRRNLLEDFVNPVYYEFEMVHKNYLESFKEYRNLIKSSNEPLDLNNSILDKIREDHLFTAGQRAKLIELSKFSKEPVVGEFVDAIQKYLIGTQDDVSGDFSYSNVWRSTLLGDLEAIFSESESHIQKANKKSKKYRSLKVLDWLVTGMQERYSLVTSEYIFLKKNLLT